MGNPTNATYGTLTLDDATVTADQLLWFGGMALMESTLTVGESEEGAGNNGKIINVTWVQPESGAMLTMDTASSVTLPQQQETDGQWRLADFQTSEDVAAAAGQLGAYLPRGWTFETITGTRVYGMSEQPYYALAVKDTAGAYPTSVTLKLITDSVPATVSANNPTYDGKEKALVNVDKSTLVGGTMYYAVTTGNTAPADDLYTISIPTATDVGTYYVWYKVVGDESHLDTQAACVTASIVAPEFGDPDFVMPEDLAAIEESAFEGVASMTVVDAHTCAAIGQYAFKDTGLKQIRLPKDCDISDAAFDEEGIVYVYAPPGGTTQATCEAHDNLAFIEE